MTIKLEAIPGANELHLICDNHYNDIEVIMIVKLNNDLTCNIVGGLQGIKNFIDNRFSNRIARCELWMQQRMNNLKSSMISFIDLLSKHSSNGKYDKFETLAVMQLIAENISQVCVIPLGNNSAVTNLVFENLDKQFYIYNSYRQQYIQLSK